MTKMVATAFASSDENLSIFMNGTIAGGLASTERMQFRTKENGVTNWNPKLEITYSPCASLVNTSWSSWSNESCLVTDLMNESRFLTQYDENVCGGANETFFEYKAEVFCDFCTPSIISTDWGAWSNLSCTSGDLMNQTSNKTNYDENFCGEVSNTTSFRFQLDGFCDYCTPDLQYYYGDWNNVNCPHSEIWNQSRETTYYDINFCSEIENETSYEYRDYGICEYTGAFVPSYFGVPTQNQTRDLLGIFSFVSQETDGLFFPIIIFCLFIIQFIGGMANGSSAPKAWVGAGFVCTILSVILGILAFIQQRYVYLLILATAIGVFWLKLSNAKE